MGKASKYSPSKNNYIYLYTKGGAFSLDGQNYVGEYHYDSGIAKTGPTITYAPNIDTSKVLQRVYNNADHYAYDKIKNFNIPTLQFVNPRPIIYKPSNLGKLAGFEIRYFVQKRNIIDSFAVEIDIVQYTAAGKKGGIDLGLYAITTLYWKLDGTKNDITRHNEIEVFKGSQQLSNIAYAVKNYVDGAVVTASGSLVSGSLASGSIMPRETVGNLIPQSIKNQLQKAIGE